MAEIKVPLQYSHHIIGDRDYALERSSRRSYFQWPFNIAYGLNSFEFFQGMNNFLMRVIDGVVGSLPGNSSPRLNSNSYIENSLPLTRFRNYHDKVI